MHPTQLFLVIQSREREREKEKRREKELSRLYVVTNLSWLCKKPALITRRNQETSSDCAGERVCVFLRYSSYVISLDMGPTLSRRYFPKVKISPRRYDNNLLIELEIFQSRVKAFIAEGSIFAFNMILKLSSFHIYGRLKNLSFLIKLYVTL